MKKVFYTETVFDSDKNKWQEDFYIDGEEVDCDTYFYVMDDELKRIKLAKEFECGSYLDDLLDIYIDTLKDVKGCQYCIKAVLTDFVDEILDLVKQK